MRSSDSEEIRIGVDARRALEVLSSNVFAGQKTCLRELIANSADSIALLPPDQLRHVEIRIIPHLRGGALEIRDNGVGMTRREASKLLGTLFSTSKDKRADTIGRFGLGFYSCFPLCSEVEVLTRTDDRDDRGTRVCYRGGGNLYVSAADVSSRGTRVRLTLLDEYRSLLEEETLRDLITRDCNFVRYPIYYGAEWTDLNKGGAPWYSACSENELRDGLEQIYDVSETYVLIPVIGVVEGCEVKGVLYITPSWKEKAVRL